MYINGIINIHPYNSRLHGHLNEWVRARVVAHTGKISANWEGGSKKNESLWPVKAKLAKLISKTKTKKFK
jgi:hypothetical protein